VDFTRPKKSSITEPRSPRGPTVNGFVDTPAEGLDTEGLPKVPMDPDEVLALLKARLALADKDLQALVPLAGTPSYESAKSAKSTWPPASKCPSSPDITPSPVVIGMDEIEALSAAFDEDTPTGDAAPGTAAYNPEFENTPAEPIASVRVRQAAAPRGPAAQAAVDLRAATSARASAPTGDFASRAGRLYFPPMKPPESWQGGSSDEPLVQVVPDCDAKTKTARSLRKPSNWPTPSYLLELRGRRSIIVLSTGALLVAFLLAVVSAYWNPSSRQPAPSVALRPTISVPTPSAGADSGAAPVTEPLSSAVPSASASVAPAPERTEDLPSRQDSKVRKAPQSNSSKQLAPGNDGLVF